MDAYQQFIFTRTYARWLPDENRRETWPEAVGRLTAFYKEIAPQIPTETTKEIFTAILGMECLPSMRLMSMAGPAVRGNNICAYNCSYLPIDCINAFAECFLILMNGTGVGFSVETEYVDKLPRVARQKDVSASTHIIEDSTSGWVNALRIGVAGWFQGYDVQFDYSDLRPAGAHLKTKGGYASGPEPLKRLLDYLRDKILSHQGRRLEPIDCHDIVCRIGEIVCVGAVRNAALISLSDLDDLAMQSAKDGQYWTSHPYRSQANNSVAYCEKPSSTAFMSEWLALTKSGTGERGVFNREGIQAQRPQRRPESAFGTNPCGEIVLRPCQFCNLTEVVARHDDNYESLRKKVVLASIMGTIQSTLTYFPGLRPKWNKNCEEERLLGVSITGVMDCANLRHPSVLQELKRVAVDTNKTYAEMLGINSAAAVTCIKPSGTVSQLVNSSSGIHCRWSRYYIRRVRISAMDPLFHMMRDAGIPHYPEVGQLAQNAEKWVLEFPVKAPDDAIVRHDVTALGQLETWLMFKKNWTEHNPSMTCYVGPDEWLKVGAWVYDNWDQIGGLSFLPKTDYVYQLAPYEDITQDEYERRMAGFPKIDYSKLSEYEKVDTTTVEMEMACVGSACELQ